jgi:hypothetical protein
MKLREQEVVSSLSSTHPKDFKSCSPGARLQCNGLPTLLQRCTWQFWTVTCILTHVTVLNCHMHLPISRWLIINLNVIALDSCNIVKPGIGASKICSLHAPGLKDGNFIALARPLNVCGRILIISVCLTHPWQLSKHYVDFSKSKQNNPHSHIFSSLHNCWSLYLNATCTICTTAILLNLVPVQKLFKGGVLLRWWGWQYTNGGQLASLQSLMYQWRDLKSIVWCSNDDATSLPFIHQSSSQFELIASWSLDFHSCWSSAQLIICEVIEYSQDHIDIVLQAPAKARTYRAWLLITISGYRLVQVVKDFNGAGAFSGFLPPFHFKYCWILDGTAIFDKMSGEWIMVVSKLLWWNGRSSALS